MRVAPSTALVLLGAVTGAHGVKGEVRIKSFTEEPQAIARYGPLRLADGRSFEIASLKPTKDGLIAKLSGIDSRDAAEALKGAELLIPRDRFPAADGDYYHADLVGLIAYDLNGECVGIVTGVHNHGAGDLIEVERVGGASVLIPFTERNVPVVDLAGERLTVDPPEGILDD